MKKNLKGNTDTLIYYRDLPLEDKTPRQRTILNEKFGKLQEISYLVNEKERRVFSEDEINNFTLDKYGTHIPYIDGEITILNNYLFDYWGYFLKAEGLSLYAHLKRHAYGNKDWCYPDLELISMKMDKSRNTINNYLDILERYGFVYKFGVLNSTRKNIEESPLFKIRKKVPLISEALLNGIPELEIDENLPGHIKQALKKERTGLPSRLKSNHDKYVKEMLASAEKVSLPYSVDFEEVYKVILESGEVVKKEKSKRDLILSKQLKQGMLLKQVSDVDRLIWTTLLDKISKLISKPAYETWFTNTYCKLDNNHVKIYCPNEFSRDWLQTRFKEQILNILRETNEELERATFYVSEGELE